MVIKPIEKADNKGMLMKMGVLTFLIGSGFILSKIPLDKKSSLDKPQVLSIQSEKVDLKKSTQDLAENVVDQSKSITGQILGDATSAATEFASKSADTVSNFIIDKVTDPIVEQIKKLPQSQQEEIKKNICD
jgi:hypothetical protein